jgi:thioredoxin-dependent peroxiredoxin
MAAKKKSRTKTKAKGKKKTKAKAKVKKTKARAAKRSAKPKKKAAARKTAKPKAAKPKAAAAKKKSAPASAVPTAPGPVTTPSTLPDVEVQTTSGPLRLSSLRGRNVVLYFYPKDDTPGCTTEGCDLRDHYSELKQANTVVLGVSRDTLDSHGKFKTKYNFPFELVSDPEEKLCRAFGVIQMKSNYGQTYMGLVRSTFLYDKDGRIRKEWRTVNVPGHIGQILDEVKKL